jgi:hypothetical protein
MDRRQVGGQVRYEDYMGNVARLVVDLVNTGAPAPQTAPLLTDHGVSLPAHGDLAELLPLLRDAVAAICDQQPPDPVNCLLLRYPPRLSVTSHDGPGTSRHLHYAADGEPALSWLGRTCAAALAHIACGTPEVTIGRCRAVGCSRFFVDQSRNRSRRFCGNACASRTTVAAHRTRQRARSR